MTVKELIHLLANIPDQDLRMMIDCPHCGKSQEMKRLFRVVLVSGDEHEIKPKPEPPPNQKIKKGG
jgi:hypothetical protein